MNKLQMFGSNEDCGFTKLLPLIKYSSDIKNILGMGEIMSRPSKMPEWAFNIPASLCKAGKHLVGRKGSGCYKCYCKDRGRYNTPVVQLALERRYRFIMFNPNFVSIMSSLIKIRMKEKFRWFDSGDLQSEKMLDDICKVCRNTPHILHWLPTKEHRMVKRYIYKGDKIPDNLDIRLSSHWNTKRSLYKTEKLARQLGVNVASTLSPDKWEKFVPSNSYIKCPSSTQGDKCLDCRACWTDKVMGVMYKFH